ncbi:endonuclease/exonuclease/phosphatase family protein [Pedobacter sp. BS3]|uniref:endonuclease/exonuclease/phosphatase family protein n=1 Tax=Pedobacter sp. BS3 TaxID=2567937 RepID=UPI00397E828A
MCDFNFDRNSPDYSLLNNSGLLRDAFELATFRYSSGGSFNHFNVNSPAKGPIDHIFVTGSRFKIEQYNILMDSYEDKLPSDHYPVLIEISPNVK